MTANTAVIDWSFCPVLESVPGQNGRRMGIPRHARAGVSVLNNLSELSVPEIVQEFSTLKREPVATRLDFIARSTESHP